MICIAIGCAAYFVLPVVLATHAVTRAIVAWNAGALLYVALALRMMFSSSHARMRERAELEDEGRIVILVLVVLAAVAALGAIVLELTVVRGAQGALRGEHIALVALTIASSWAFTHIMFALHYAHDFYSAHARTGAGGLSFPGTEQPDYGDFLYFSCVIGTSAQTADVSFISRSMRRVGLVHCVLAFFFNTTVLALTVNIASTLL